MTLTTAPKNWMLSCLTLALVSVSPQAMATAANVEPASVNVTEVAASQSAEISEGAFKFVQATAEKGLKFLSNPDADVTVKRAEFRKLLDQSFDLETIGRFALGTYWRSATPAQQKEYQALFRKMVVDVYTARFNDYKGQQFQTKGYRSIGQNDTLVNSLIIPADGGQPIAVDWRVRSKGGSYKIVDVLVSGVSMSVTQRSDFASVIQRGGGNVDVLINHLKSGPKKG
jgi:phospholipid transport system substrate-binding protein